MKRALRVLPLAFVCAAFAGSQWQSSDRQADQAALIQLINREAAAERLTSCRVDNVTRGQLRQLVVSGRDNLDAYQERGLITRKEYRETLDDQDEALRLLADRPCLKVRNRYLRRIGLPIPK